MGCRGIRYTMGSDLAVTAATTGKAMEMGRPMENQAIVQETPELLVETEQREQCDSCSARAMVKVDLPFGNLWFCLHHYNKNAEALTDKGGIAKLLSTTNQIGVLMINNFKGKNIVQPTGGSRGGWTGKLFGMMRSGPMAQMQLQMFGAQQEKMTEEIGKRKIAEAAAKAAGKIVTDRATSQGALEHAMNVHNTVYKQYGADHPEVKAGNVKATDFVYPGMATYGMPENTGSMTWSSRSAAAAALAKEEISKRNQNAPVGEGATDNNTPPNNNTPPTPPAAGGAAKASKKKKNGSSNTTNVSAPKVTPPSATPPWHRG